MGSEKLQATMPAHIDLSSQEPDPNLLDQQVSEKTFAHVLEDGRKVTGTLEQARRLCPVIGDMTLEDARATLNDADLAQRIVERRRARKQAEEQHDDRQQTPANIEQKVEPRKKESKNQVIADTLSLMEDIKQIPEHGFSLNAEMQQAVTAEQHLAEANTALVYEIEQSTGLAEDILHKQVEIQNIIGAPQRSEQYLGNSEAQMIVKAEPRATETAKSMPDFEINILRRGLHDPDETLDLVQPIQQEFEHSNNSPAFTEASESQELGMVPEETTFDILATHEKSSETLEVASAILPDEEIMDIYQQLIDLSKVTEEVEGQDLAVPEQEEVADPVINSFEVFIDSILQPEEPLGIEEIKKHADDQPLEETLAELAAYLTDAAESSAEETIVGLLQELNEEIEQEQITLEITRKLLVLIQEIGYENPQQALIEMVSRHDLEFLVQSIRYLYHLANEDNQQEFLIHKPKARAYAMSYEPAVVRWGRAIFGLIKPQYANFEPAAAD